MLVTLGEAGIKTIDDLGDLATYELIDPGNREGEGRGILADYRLDEDEAVINRLGFNSGGLDDYAARLEARPWGRPP